MIVIIAFVDAVQQQCYNKFLFLVGEVTGVVPLLLTSAANDVR